MVKAADAMGFVKAEAAPDTERCNAALSWVLHDSLCESLYARLAPHVARAIQSICNQTAPRTRDGTARRGQTSSHTSDRQAATT